MIGLKNYVTFVVFCLSSCLILVTSERFLESEVKHSFCSTSMQGSVLVHY